MSTRININKIVFRASILLVFFIISCESLSTIPGTNYPGYITPDSISHAIPLEFKINTVYPNPFDQEANIMISIPIETEISLVIQNPIGDVVKVLLSQKVSADYYNIVWNGTNDKDKKVNKGKYFVTLNCKSRNINLSQIIKYGN
jgi:hypothetical protein